MAKTTTVREAIAAFEKAKGVVAADEAKVTVFCHSCSAPVSHDGPLC